MLQGKFVKDYFRKKGTVIGWWHPEQGTMAPIYAREINIIQEFIKDRPIKGEILDVSCGKGRVTKQLYRSFKVTALDISEEMISFVQDLNLPGVSTVRGDAENLPLKDDSFDGIVCIKSFVHYPNPEKTLKEFYRVLKKGGILVVDIDNKYSLRWLVKNVVIFFYKIIYPRFKQIGHGIFVLYSENNFINLIRKSNFSVEKVRYLSIISPINVELTKRKITLLSSNFSRRLEFLDKFLERIPIFRKASTYIYVKCRK